MSQEVWKEVPSAPFLMASNMGRVMVKPHVVRGRTYGGTPRFGCAPKGERRFIFVYKGKTHKVHQLVCEAFNGPKPFPKAVVRHLDEDWTNNRPENLKWGTQKENLNEPGFIAYCRSRTGDRNPHRIGRARAKLAHL